MDGDRQLRGNPYRPATRRGSAIFLAIIMGIVFFMVVSSLLHYLSGERRQVKHVIGKKQAELLAISGIDWADQQLRKGRWYQDPSGKPKVTGEGRPTFGVNPETEQTPFGPGMGKVTIICEDVPVKQPIETKTMQQLWLLHHINVFALGEYEGYRCLLYGRFIMSPEPALNSDSTDGVFVKGADSTDEVGVPKDKTGQFQVTKIFIRENQEVDPNQDFIELKSMDDGSRIFLHPPKHGKVRKIHCTVGDLVSSDDDLVTMGKIGSSPDKTLKRMVRVTRIEALPWANLDISDFEDRRALSRYMGILSKVYLLNYGARPDLEKAANDYRNGGLPPVMSPEEFLKKFPARVRNSSKNRAENEFMDEMLRQFTLAPAVAWPNARKKTKLKLNYERTNLPGNISGPLQAMGLTDLSMTKPRRNPDYVDLNLSSDDYIRMLNAEKNEAPKEFIKKLSELWDTYRTITVAPVSASATPSAKGQSGSWQEVVRPDYPAKVTVAPESEEYNFEDPVSGYTGKAKDVLTFIGKYHADSADGPNEPKRSLEFLDWPFPEKTAKGPVPATPEGLTTPGKWVWDDGMGTPPGPPTVKTTGGKVRVVPFPSGGNRDHEVGGNDPDGGQRSYGVDGVAPTRGSSGDTKSGRAPDGSGRMDDDNGAAPISDSGDSTQGGAAPVTDDGGTPSGARPPGPDGSIFSTQAPAAKIPTGGTTTLTPGTPGIPPRKGEYRWVETTCGGSPPAGGEGAWAQDGVNQADAKTDANKLGGDNPAKDGEADGDGQDMTAQPAAEDGHASEQDGNPGKTDGFGLEQDGGPGTADGDGTGLDDNPGDAERAGFEDTGPDGEATADKNKIPGNRNETTGVVDKPGSTPSTAFNGPSNNSRVFTCPKCGKLHENKNYKGNDGNNGGGGAPTSRSGKC